MSLKKMNVNERLEILFFLKIHVFVQNLQLVWTSILKTAYYIFHFESLYDLHFGISKLFSESLFMFICLNRLTPKPDRAEVQWQPPSIKRVLILGAVNSLAAAIDRNLGVPGEYVDLSSKGFSEKLNGLFLNSGVRGRVKGNDDRAVDRVLLNTRACIDGI